MIRTLPPDHNHTTRRFARSRLDAWQCDFAECIEAPPRRGAPWALYVPILLTVMVLALLYQVQQRHEERRAIVQACEAVQHAERASPAACRSLIFATLKEVR